MSMGRLSLREGLLAFALWRQITTHCLTAKAR